MVELKELSNDAIALLKSLNTRIDSRVISKASTLKPQVVSIASRFIDISNMLVKMFEGISEKYGDVKADEVVRIEPSWTISVIDEKLIITRLKPTVVSISFSKQDSKITVSSKKHHLEIQPGSIRLRRLGMSVDFDPGDPDNILNKINEIKYLLREIAYIIELVTSAFEKKLA